MALASGEPINVTTAPLRRPRRFRNREAWRCSPWICWDWASSSDAGFSKLSGRKCSDTLERARELRGQLLMFCVRCIPDARFQYTIGMQYQPLSSSPMRRESLSRQPHKALPVIGSPTCWRLKSRFMPVQLLWNIRLLMLAA